MLVAAFSVAVALWSRPTLDRSASALAQIKLPIFAGSLIRAAAVAPDQNQPRAQLGEALRRLKAQPRGCPGDDANLALHAHTSVTQ